jgi:hypothetical protein
MLRTRATETMVEDMGHRIASSRSDIGCDLVRTPAETGFLALAHLHATAAVIGPVPYDRPNEHLYHAITTGTTGTWDGLPVRRLSHHAWLVAPVTELGAATPIRYGVQLPCSELLMPCAVAVGPRTADRRVLRGRFLPLFILVCMRQTPARDGTAQPSRCSRHNGMSRPQADDFVPIDALPGLDGQTMSWLLAHS